MKTHTKRAWLILVKLFLFCSEGDRLLKSCKYCQRIHDKKFDCGKKPKRYKQGNDKDKFRWTQAWQNKREEIRQRDLNLCQVCIRKLCDTVNQYNYDRLEVHHAESLEDNFDKRLDNDNLITLCEKHHEMAEKKEIPLKVILQIITEQEEKSRKYTP